MILTFLVRYQTLSLVDTRMEPRQGSSNYLQLKFIFATPDWKGLRKTLHLSSGEYSEPFILESDIFDVPEYYTQQNSFNVTLLGDADDQLVPTNVLEVFLSESNHLWTSKPPDPQNSAYIQLLGSIGNLAKLQTKAKNNIVEAINELTQRSEHLYAYNFTTVDNKWFNSPQDAQALNYIVQNWNKAPMSIYIQGYPVIGIDLNDRYLRVLRNDRYLYSFRWEVKGNLVKLAAHALVKLVSESQVNKYVEALEAKLTDYIVEQGRSANGWDYCKWASGRAECYKNITSEVPANKFVNSGLVTMDELEILGIKVNFGIFWTRDIPIQLDYPFEFEHHPVETATISNGSAWFPLTLISTTAQSTTKTDSYRICSFKQPDKALNVKISLHVTGKWKMPEEVQTTV